MKYTVLTTIAFSLIASLGNTAPQTQCDLLSSYERDHLATATAVDTPTLIRTLEDAKLACENDIVDHPEEPRLKFQLARILLADDMNDEGLTLMRQVADQGYPVAQYWIGLIYREGNLVPQDNEVAAQWYARSAESGNPYAMYNLAVMKRRGTGVETDLVGAVALYQSAADLGHVSAMANLGTMHLKGLGTPQDDDAAFTLMRLAAQLGSMDAMYNMGFFYETGIGTTKDIDAALEWYGEAANLGDDDAAAAVSALSR